MTVAPLPTMQSSPWIRRATSRWAAVALALGALLIAALAAADAQLDASLAGIWAQRGYGRILDISAQRLTTYDVTGVSCARMSEQSLADANKNHDRISRGPDELSLFETGGITRYHFERMRQLPQSCRSLPANAPPVRDPATNYSVLWHAFQEHYAFFPLRRVNWNEIDARFRPRVSAASTDEKLFDLFAELLATLNDNHVVLRAGKRKFEGGTQGEFLELWRSSVGSDAGYEAAVHAHVLDEVLKGKARFGANDTMMWGWAAPGIGYINTTEMELSPDGGARLTLPEQLQLVRRTMAEVMKDLGGAKTLIVDARFNDGGYDAVALEIMGSFTRERRLAFTKKAVDGKGYTPEQDIYFGRAAQRSSPARSITCKAARRSARRRSSRSR